MFSNVLLNAIAYEVIEISNRNISKNSQGNYTIFDFINEYEGTEYELVYDLIELVIKEKKEMK